MAEDTHERTDDLGMLVRVTVPPFLHTGGGGTADKSDTSATFVAFLCNSTSSSALEGLWCSIAPLQIRVSSTMCHV